MFITEALVSNYYPLGISEQLLPTGHSEVLANWGWAWAAKPADVLCLERGSSWGSASLHISHRPFLEDTSFRRGDGG